jgi:hypothetical protein
MDGGGTPTSAPSLPCELRELVDDKFESNTPIILRYPEHLRKAVGLNFGESSGQQWCS